MNNGSVRATGIHFSGGKLYVATVELESGAVAPLNHARITPSDTIPEADAFVDLRDRIRQFLLAQRPERAGIVETRRHNSWAYREAYRRVFAICSALSASIDARVPCSTVKTEEIARSVETAPKTLSAVELAKVGLDSRPKYWTAGLGDAFACAAHLCISGG